MRYPFLGDWLKRIARAHRFVMDKSGNVLITFSVAAPFTLGIVGYGVEAGLLYRIKRAEQTAADAGAIAGAIIHAKGAGGSVAAAAMQLTALNGFAHAPSTTVVTVNNPPASGPNVGDSTAVEVIITTLQPALMQLSAAIPGASNGPHTVVSRAVAKAEDSGEACVLALDKTASPGLKNSGSSNLNMAGCVLAANSSADPSIQIGGSANITADTVWTVGSSDLSGSSNVSLEKPPQNEMWPLVDPYADLVITPPSSCDYNNYNINAGTATLSAGTYCNGINIGGQAHVTFNPGTYYIDRGDLTMGAQSTVTCNCTAPDGVTFVLTSSTVASQIGTVKIGAGATVTLSAPSGPASNPYVGLLIVQDPKAPTAPSSTMKLVGGSGQKLSGGIYVPKQLVELAGSTDAAKSCLQIVALQVTFIGDSQIDNSGCAAMGVKPIKLLIAKLVE